MPMPQTGGKAILALARALDFGAVCQMTALSARGVGVQNAAS